MLRRVNITGIGPVSPAGIGHEAFFRGIFQARSRAGKFAVGEGGSVREVAAATVPDFRVGAYALDAAHLNSPRYIQFALAATMLALRHAGLPLVEVRKRKPIVALAGPVAERGGLGRMANGSAGIGQTQAAVARWVAARSETASQPPAFFSALEAVGYAAGQVAMGAAELAICGGVDAPLQPEILADMQSLGLSAAHADDPERHCRPFDLWRTTGLAGEGGCVFVVEPETSARPGLARIAGSGSGREAGRAPWSGFAEAVRLALGNARLRPALVDCIHAEGTGQKALDRAEAAALADVFGRQLGTVPVSALQGAVGNALAGAAAIQLGCAVLGLKHSRIAPTVNWQHPDPACPLNLSVTARAFEAHAALVSARDARGSVTCLLLTP